MIKCPNCFVPVPTLPTAGYCEQGVCDSREIAAAIGRPSSRRGDRDPWPLACGHGADGHGEICSTCKYRMAPRWREAPTTCVVMAGAPATGKSIYLAVLIKQLEQCGEHLNMKVRPGNADIEKVFREVFEKPLYEERGIMPPTPPLRLDSSYAHQPLVFELSAAAGGRHHLVIRDIGGEDLDRTPLDMTHLTFFPLADGVIYLFDPLQVDDIRDKLPDLVPTSQLQQGNPVRVLENTLRLIGTGRPKLAVVMSKFDAMQALQQVRRSHWSQVMGNAGAAFFRDPGPLIPYNDVDGQLLHEEVRSLLQLLEAGMSTTLESSHRRTGVDYRYFAVSALGDPPRGQALSARGIAPFRCLDPLRWVMAGSGIL